MEIVKKTKVYIIYKKKTGRYGIRGMNKVWVRGDEKVKILVDEGLLDLPTAVQQEKETNVDDGVNEEVLVSESPD